MPDHETYGIMLASGHSKRFGSDNKLLAAIDGISVIRRTLDAYLQILDRVFVVVGHDADVIWANVSDLPVERVDNPNFDRGQSSSLRAGVLALPRSAQAAVIGVGDQPLITVDIVRALIDRYTETEAPIVAARYEARRGNPVLFKSNTFPALLQVTGDVGGRAVFDNWDVKYVDFADSVAALDVDDADDLMNARKKLRKRGPSNRGDAST